MKYYLVSIVTDSGVEQRLCEPTEGLENAIMQFHQKMAYCIAKAEITDALVMVINSVGGIEKNETFKRTSTPTN